MALSYSRPPEHLGRELEEVARAARELMECLNGPTNQPLPRDFPKGQLADICTALIELPQGTGQGCRATLDYARNRLPRIRREFVHIDHKHEPVDEHRLVRGALLDVRLTSVMSAVSTAWDEYRRAAAEELLPESEPEPGVSPKPGTVDSAVEQSRRLNQSVGAATKELDEVAFPSSTPVEELRRQLADVQVINRASNAEMQMPEVTGSWLSRLLSSLKLYPAVIQRSLKGIRIGVDVFELAYNRWHDFNHNGMHFLISEIRKSVDAGEDIVQLIAKTSRSIPAGEKDRHVSLPQACADVLIEKRHPMSSVEILKHLKQSGIADQFKGLKGNKPSKLVYAALRQRSEKVGDVIMVGIGYWNLTELVPKSDVTKLKKARKVATAHSDKTKAGLEKARAKGKKLGAPMKIGDAQRAEAERLFAQGASIPQVSKAIRVSQPVIRNTFPDIRLRRWVVKREKSK